MYKRTKILAIISLIPLSSYTQPEHYIRLEDSIKENVRVAPEDAGLIIDGKEELNLNASDPFTQYSFNELLAAESAELGDTQSTIDVARVAIAEPHSIQHRFYSAPGLLQTLMHNQQNGAQDIDTRLPIDHITIFRLNNTGVVNSLSGRPRINTSLRSLSDFTNDEADKATRRKLQRAIQNPTTPAARYTAMINLAGMLHCGRGGSQDSRQARSLLQEVLSAPNHEIEPKSLATAQLELANMLEFGLGGPQDIPQACNLLNQVTLSPDGAINPIARNSARADLAEMLQRLEGEHNLQQPRQLFQQVLDSPEDEVQSADRITAQFGLAQILRDTGRGSDALQACNFYYHISRDPEAEFTDRITALFEFSATLQRIGGEKNLQRARTTYQAIIDYRHEINLSELAHAQVNLANMLVRGHGGERDLPRARQLLEDVLLLRSEQVGQELLEEAHRGLTYINGREQSLNDNPPSKRQRTS